MSVESVIGIAIGIIGICVSFYFGLFQDNKYKKVKIYKKNFNAKSDSKSTANITIINSFNDNQSNRSGD